MVHFHRSLILVAPVICKYFEVHYFFLNISKLQRKAKKNESYITENILLYRKPIQQYSRGTAQKNIFQSNDFSAEKFVGLMVNEMLDQNDITG